MVDQFVVLKLPVSAMGLFAKPVILLKPYLLYHNFNLISLAASDVFTLSGCAIFLLYLSA
jgi:hypothetical protein